MPPCPTDQPAALESVPALPRPLTRSLVLVGMPGSGKSTIGRKLAGLLNLTFVDADAEIEKAAGMTVPEIFANLGEPAFREGERRVIARLLDGQPCVLATGGGAFMDESTRAKTKDKGISIWLRVDIDTLAGRTARNNNRPLLNNADPRATLNQLLDKRGGVYAGADIAIACDDRPADDNAGRVLAALYDFMSEKV